MGLAAARRDRDPRRVWRRHPRETRRGATRRSRLGLLVTVEAIRTPVGFTPVYGIPRLYDRFATASDVVIAEFPFYSGANVSLNGPYVLANTRYFKPLLNGYSSFHPDTFEARGRALNSFPSEAALAELKVARVTHVLVHTQDFAGATGAGRSRRSTRSPSFSSRRKKTASGSIA